MMTCTQRHIKTEVSHFENTGQCCGKDQKKGQGKERVKKGLIHAHVFHILVLYALHKCGAVGAFLGEPKATKHPGAQAEKSAVIAAFS